MTTDANSSDTKISARELEDVERHETLDPSDWQEFRLQAHGLLDDLIAHIESIRQRPVWQPAPNETRARFAKPLRKMGVPLADVIEQVRADIMPFATGNLHPRFMGWVHGAGTPVGMLAEMVAAALNMNCGAAITSASKSSGRSCAG